MKYYEKNLKNNDRRDLYKKIYKRAKKMGLCCEDLRSCEMDLVSADYTFNLRLEEWLRTDDFNFAHDWNGIANCISRDRYPCTDFGLFVPRFAGK